jgi:hypothetical protein
MDERSQTTEWEQECLKWRGRVLTGRYAHYCFDWDGLPVDETCPEWDCGCRWEENQYDR